MLNHIIVFLQELIIIFILMQADTRSLTSFQKIYNIGFNLRYAFMGMLQSWNSDNLVQEGDSIYFLGRKIEINKHNAEKQNEFLYKIFSDTPWLTYRAGFPQLYHHLKGTYVTDTGWGCMIRVGQMAFAQIIREHLQIKTHDNMAEVINFFNDCDKTKPFSIHNISKIARKQYGIMPGDWYNPSQISLILSTLNQSYLESKLKLSFVVFNNGNLFFDQILQVMMNNNPIKLCKCMIVKKQLICEKCNTNQRSIGLVLLTRIGLDSPQEKYLHVLGEMMKFKQFKGVIGGKPGKALYFLGLHNQSSFIYLDPHYVQPASGDISQIKQSYFCGSFRTCKAKNIDPSVGICYYLRNLQELNQFYSEVIRLRDKQLDDFFIWASEETPSYLTKSIRISKCFEVEEDHYQNL